MRDGKELPPPASGNPVMTVKGESAAMKIGDMTSAAAIKVDATKTPRTLDVTPEDGPEKGKTVPCIYEIKGDELRVCTAEAGTGRPTEFSAKEGSGWTLLTFKRVQEVSAGLVQGHEPQRRGQPGPGAFAAPTALRRAAPDAARQPPSHPSPAREEPSMSTPTLTAAVWNAAEDPLLCLERKAYLNAMLNALAGLEARVLLAGVVRRLDRGSPGATG